MNQEPKQSDIKRWEANLRSETDGAALYNALAESEKDEQRAEIFRHLAEVEERHGSHWARKLQEAGVNTAGYRPGIQARALGWFARLFGARTVLPFLRALEEQGNGMYRNQPDAERFSVEERTHVRVISELTQGASPGGDVKAEPWHRSSGGGSIRASVFGLNDGLVSNLSLVMGVAGAGPDPRFILLAGVAGLLAGAFSMGAGEYISVRAQREVFERQINLEGEELQANPEEEEEELSLIYQAKGIAREQADTIAAQVIRDRTVALDTLAREELGLDPRELGSPWKAAISSFALFASGAVVPVLPFVFGMTGVTAIVISAILSGLALAGFGAALSFLTGRSALYSGARMLLIGAGAATLTFMIGRLIGVTTT